MQTLYDIYQHRCQHFKAKAGDLRRRYNLFSLVRLLVFVLSLGLIVYLYTLHWSLGVICSGLFLTAFYRFVHWHGRILRQADYFDRLSNINAWEKNALDHDTKAYSSGKEWVDTTHPYTYDLDIFGEGSLYPYLNRTTTFLGAEKLAVWLLSAAPVSQLQPRQEVLPELRDNLEWRQAFQATGMETQDARQNLHLLETWLAEPALLLHNRWWVVVLYGCPALAFVAAISIAYGLPWNIALWLLLPAAVALISSAQKITRIHERTSKAAEVLSYYSLMIRHIETAPDWKSPGLQRIKAVFYEGKVNASQETQRLAYIISQLNVRFNFFAIFLNLALVWDLQWVYRLEKWKTRGRRRLSQWFDAMAEMEALCSLANAWYNNPDWTLPTFRDTLHLEAVALGHPLIPFAKRVSNDLSLPLDGHIKLITGSNMAGKSTFLRTVGINAVLAQAGAPVCAEKLELCFLAVFTSMRTQDALLEGASSFYAELKRLKQIIESVEGATSIPVLFLLDEILKGTNSVDRHTGAKALVQQLIQNKGSGIVATHDLELGGLEASAAGKIENLCMEVEIQDDKLFFDYKLKKGISKSFNATLLMRRMGIRI